MRNNPGLVTGITGVDPSILQVPTGDSVATVPIARLLDTDTYDGANPAISLGTIGLAEFTSANFFSDDTARTTSLLPFPDVSRLQPGPIVNSRQYFSKSGDGVSVTHMAGESLWNRFLPAFFNRYVLDDAVYADYASHLLSRAIGYATALLDYFFRGRMELEEPHNPGVGRVNIRNSSPPGDETEGPGELTIVLPMENGIYEIRGPFSVNLSRDFQTLSFNGFYFPDNPSLDGRLCIRDGAVPCDVHFLYRGPLGQESDAVMVMRSPIAYD